jgi:hypothetical protein
MNATSTSAFEALRRGSNRLDIASETNHLSSDVPHRESAASLWYPSFQSVEKMKVVVELAELGFCQDGSCLSESLLYRLGSNSVT